MKYIEFTTTKGDFLVIEDDRMDYDVIHDSKFKHALYQLIGRIADITEEQAKEVVDESPRTYLFAHYVNGVNPPNIYQYSSAIPSLRSLLGVNGVLFNNTFGDRSKVWNKQQTYLFKKL